MSKDIFFCKSVEVHVQFQIPNFFDLSKKECAPLQSPDFCMSGAMWYLMFHPYTLKNSVQYIGLFLERRHHIRDHQVYFKCSIKKVFSPNREGDALFTLEDDSWGWDEFYKRDDLITSKNTLAPDGSITILCTARAVDDNEDISHSLQRDGKILSGNLKDLYISRNFSDATIVVKGKEFPVHRNILAARSKVFAAMFRLDMKEKRTGKVKIEDCDPDSFKEFLLFLYTGKLNDVSLDQAINIYMIADKYDITELKTECVFHMIITLSVDSFCDVFYLAFIHYEIKLLTEAKKFFFDNAKDILLTTQWQSFLIQYPILGNDLFLKLVEKCKE